LTKLQTGKRWELFLRHSVVVNEVVECSLMSGV